MPKKEPTAPPIYPNIDDDLARQQLEDNGMTFRLRQISEIRSFLESENETRSRLRRRYKSVYNTFYYVSTASGITAVGAGTAGMTALGTGIGAPVALPLGIVSIGMGALSVGASAVCKLVLKKVEKHERIKNVAMAKMSSITGLVSNALKDNTISNEEFQIILQEHESYREHKKQIRERVRTEVQEINELLKEQIRQTAEKKGEERGRKQAMETLLNTVRDTTTPQQ